MRGELSTVPQLDVATANTTRRMGGNAYSFGRPLAAMLAIQIFANGIFVINNRR